MAAEQQVVTRDSTKAEAEAEAGMDQVRADLHLAENVDPLDAILALDKTAADITETFDIPLVDKTVVPWTVRSLTGDEIDEADEACTSSVRVGRGAREKKRDTQRFERMIVAIATVKPNLEDPRLKAKYGQAQGEQLIKRILLPGTYDGLSGKILEVSGYTDDLIATAGN